MACVDVAWHARLHRLWSLVLCRLRDEQRPASGEPKEVLAAEAHEGLNARLAATTLSQP